jgi:hypothetical protein
MKRLYRFPVVFPADAWQSVMPHEMVAWTANQKMLLVGVRRGRSDPLLHEPCARGNRIFPAN